MIALVNGGTYQVIQGSRTDINPAFLIALKQDDIMYAPVDLTGATAITACFENTDGTELMLALAAGITIVGNALLGTILLSLTAAQTALLKTTAPTTLELAITPSGGGGPFKIQIPNAYEVLQTVC